jgi:hypothetical protein
MTLKDVSEYDCNVTWYIIYIKIQHNKTTVELDKYKNVM